MIVIISYIIFQLFLIILLLLIFLELFQDFVLGKVPYIPTPIKIIEELLHKINVSPKIVYDLGAGDARFLIAFKRKFPSTKVIGFENSLLPYLYGKIKILYYNLDIKLLHKNFFKQNISQADLIFCFLGPEQMKRLEKKFDEELKKDAIIISNTFTIPHWHIKEKYILGTNKSAWNKIYIYQK